MIRHSCWLAVAVGCGVFAFPSTETASAATVIVRSAPTSYAEKLAAKEIRRYVYLRSGALLPIAAEAGRDADAIVLKTDPVLPAQEYSLKTTDRNGRQALTISGGSPIAVLYG